MPIITKFYCMSQQNKTKDIDKKITTTDVVSTFKSVEMSWVILILASTFNLLAYFSFYRKALPMGMNGVDLAPLEAFIFCLIMVILNNKVMFSQNWEQVEIHSPGTIVLVCNVLMMVLLMDIFSIPHIDTIRKSMVAILPVVVLWLMSGVLQDKK